MSQKLKQQGEFLCLPITRHHLSDARQSLLETLFDDSPVAIAVTRLSDNTLVTVNSAWEQLTGFTKKEVVLRSPFELNLWEKYEARQAFLDLLIKQKTVKNFEFNLRHKSGRILNLLISARCIEQEDLSYKVLMAQDITPLKKLAQALAEKKRRYAIAERMAHVGHWERDFESDTAHWSPEVYRIFGLDSNRPGPSYNRFLEILHPDDRERVIREVDRARATCSPTEFTYRIVRPCGEIRYIRSLISTTSQIKGRANRLIGTLLDITRQHQMSQRLDAIARSERQAICRDLHDSICQNLSGMAFLLDGILGEINWSRETAAEKIHRAIDLTSETIDLARNIANGLKPLEDGPDALLYGLESLSEYIHQIYRIPCNLSSTFSSLDLPSDISTQLLLIAREAAINSCKHAEANRIEISITRSSSFLILQIRDDGKGMSKTISSEGHGLHLMHDRAAIIGAELNIVSRRGMGTMVKCRMTI